MKLVLLAPGSTIHTIRWANGLSRAGIDVYLVTQHPLLEALEPAIEVVEFPERGVAGYFLMVPGARRAVRAIKPDLVNAHYASGYGTTGRLIGYHPFLLSVWGEDVYDFPYISPLHRLWVRGNLMAADLVASTSHCMAAQTRKVAPALTEIPVTPFGVDMQAFTAVDPLPRESGRPVVIGTVKTMGHKYGIDTLISAFALLRQKLAASAHPAAAAITLRLVGDGPQTGELKALAERLGVADAVVFVGRIPHKDVPQELARLDIFSALSRNDSESFGVAIIEASAAGRPVVVSDAGGLPEVVRDGVTGLVVSREDPAAAADALHALVIDPARRAALGQAGRSHVGEHYAWDSCISTMISVYERALSG